MTQSPDTSNSFTKASWLLLAIGLSAFEIFVPRIPLFPWLKPGFANLITIIWIMRYGTHDALLFTCIRTWIVGYYFGFSFLTLLLSISGGICSTLVMGFFWFTLAKHGYMGSVGISIVGAIIHNTTQLCVVYFVLAHNASIFYQIPLMIFASIITGGIIGLCVPKTYSFLTKHIVITTPPPQTIKQPVFKWSVAIAGIGVLAFCMALVFVSSFILLGSALFISIIGAQIASQWKLSNIFKPLQRFWPLFLFLALINCFFSYGTRIQWLLPISYEGCIDTAVQWMRLFCWLQMTYVLNRLHFHELFFWMLKKIFPNQTSTLMAGLLAIEYFPELFRMRKFPVDITLRSFIRHPIINTKRSVVHMYHSIIDQMTISVETNA